MSAEADSSPAVSPEPTGGRTPAKARGARRRFTNGFAWLVLVIALLASAAGWQIARQREELAAQKRFDEEASRIRTALTQRMAIYQDVLHGAAGLFAASYSVERSEWKAYLESVSVERRFPGISGVEFVANVPRDQLAEFLKITREDKTPRFELKNPGTNDPLFIIKYIEPEARYHALLGLDLGRDPERRAVAEKARDENAAVISGRLGLREPEARPESGFLMLMPVYRHGAGTSTVAERRAAIEGWVCARFITAQLMREVLGEKAQLLRCEVSDEAEAGPNKLIFDGTAGEPAAGTNYQPRFSVAIPFQVGGRLWMLHFTTRPAFDATIPHGNDRMVAAGGGLISLLLFSIALSLSTTRERALAIVDDRTAALRAANLRLQSEIAERQRAQRRMAAQYALARVLAEATNLGEATPIIVQAICESLGWDVGALWRVNPQTRCLHCVEIWHRPGLAVGEFKAATLRMTFHSGEGLPGQVWAQAKPLWFPEVATQGNFPRAPFAAQCGLHEALGCPVLLGEEVLGVIEFFSHKIEQPDAELLKMMTAAGSQIGQFMERKRSEAALRDSEASYQSLVESLPLQILRKDKQGRFTFANQRFCAEVGKPLAEILGRTDAEVYPSAVAAQHQQVDTRVIECGITVETVEEHPAPGGLNRFLQVIKAPVRDGAGALIGLLGICWDVTDRRHAEAALEHERFLLRTLMDNLPDRMYFKDIHSRFLRVNKAMLAMHALSHESEIMGKTDFDLFTEEHARQAFEDEQQVIRTGQPLTKEEKETWPDRSATWVWTTKMPLRSESGQIIGTFGISRDITARKRAEAALRVAKETAEEASRAKSQFLASMSHELRTPLNSVIGFANILLKNKSGGLSAAELTFLERIVANGNHLLSLINEILDLSKIEARKVELQIAPVPLAGLIRETVAQQESLVRDKPVQLRVALPDNVAPFLTDAEKLKQVIINLIGNALKFTERGSVTVRLVADPQDHHPLRIEVADTGIGIAQDKLGLIFDAFQQAEAGTARKYGGTGLGLTISQALCQLLGYHIEVASEVDRGSTFSVILRPTPEIAAGVATVAVPPKPAASPASATISVFHGKRVLVIDDELDSRTLLTHLIGDCGCQVMAADSGAQGLALAREFRPDLITLDLMMPNLDGWGVVGAIKADAQLRHIPVVVVSVVASENRGHVLGAVDVLQKPVSRAELLAVLERNLTPPKPKLLIIDDDSDAQRMIAAHLEDAAAEIRSAKNGRAALDLLEHFSPDLAVLDLMMPDMDGLEFLAALRRDPRFQQLPVVVVTAKDLTPAEAERLKAETLRVFSKAQVFAGEFKRLLAEVLCPATRPPENQAP